MAEHALHHTRGAESVEGGQRARPRILANNWPWACGTRPHTGPWPPATASHTLCPWGPPALLSQLHRVAAFRRVGHVRPRAVITPCGSITTIREMPKSTPSNSRPRDDAPRSHRRPMRRATLRVESLGRGGPYLYRTHAICKSSRRCFLGGAFEDAGRLKGIGHPSQAWRSPARRAVYAGRRQRSARTEALAAISARVG